VAGSFDEKAAAVMADTLQEFAVGRAMRRAGHAAIIYDAFISYSHAKDKPVATALQSVVQKLGKAWYRRRALRVFRDDTSLSATPHLWPSIEQALGQSRFLILLSSPEAGASRWVGREIAYWLDHNNADTVLIALTEGELAWDQATGDFHWSDATPLPIALKNRFATEPRWIDLRQYREGDAPKGTEFISLGADFASAIHGIPKEDLLSEEVRQQRRARTLAGTAVTLLVALLIAAFWQWRVAENQRGIAEAQTKVAEAQTKEAQLQRNEAQLQRDTARVQLLAAQARRTQAEADTLDDIARAAALALESVELARRRNRSVEADAIETAGSALRQLPLAILAHGSTVRSLAVLADGRVASGGEDGKVKIWPLSDEGKPTVLSHGSEIDSLAVLPDGRLASGGRDGKIRLWLKNGAGAPAVLSHGSPVLSVAVLPDGRLASGAVDGNIKLWPSSGVGDPAVLSQGSPVHSLAVLLDGRLASGDEDGAIKIWPRGGAGKPVQLWHGAHVYCLAVLADGRLAGAGQDGTIKIWPKEGRRGEPVVLSQPAVLAQGFPAGFPVYSLAVLADGRLASGNLDGTIKIWPQDEISEPEVTSKGGATHISRRIGSSKPVVLWHSHSKTAIGLDRLVYALAVLPDGRLASAGQDGTIKLWPKEGADQPLVLSPDSLAKGSNVSTLAVLADGRLASANLEGTIKLWPKNITGEPAVLSHGSPVFSLAVLPDGRLASGGFDGNINLWPKEARGEPAFLDHGEPGSDVRSLAVLSDGRLASGGYDGKIKLWPKQGVGQPTVLSHGSPVRALAVLVDGRLASGGEDGKVKLWPRDETGEPTVLSHGSSVFSLAALPDGRLASGGEDGGIRLWPEDARGGPTVLWHGGHIYSLAVLADGRLASGGEDGNIRLWPQDSAGEPVVLSHGSPVESLAVLPDGHLASGDVDGTIKLWLVDEQKLIVALCLRAGRNLTKDEWARYIGSDTPWHPSCRDLPSNWRTPDL
jgi:WD40 repeat protein